MKGSFLQRGARVRFFTVRWRQLMREAAAVGGWRLLILLAITAAVALLLYQQMQVFPNCLVVTGLLTGCLAAVHLQRNDLFFIDTTGLSVRGVLRTEYIVGSLPALLLLFLSPYPYCGFILLAAGLFLPFLRFRKSKGLRGVRPVPWIPHQNFEWIAGLRKNRWLLLPLYGGALLLLPYAYVSLFLWWLMTTVVSSFYSECEPQLFLQLPEQPPARFLKDKLRLHLRVYAVCSLPVLGGYLIFHPADAWVVVLAYLFSLINLTFFLLSKYAAYVPDQKHTGQTNLASLLHLLMLVPFLCPLPLVMSIRAYAKAKQNLKPYLHAYA